MIKIENKKAQEEMVGFAMIMVIVVIALMFLLFLFMRGGEVTAESYEAGNFLQALLSYTTSCQDRLGNKSIDRLIIDCANIPDLECTDGKNVCDVLNDTIKEILYASWQVGPEWPIKGYELDVYEVDADGNFKGDIISPIKEGVPTPTYRTATQPLPPDKRIFFKIYYSIDDE